MALGIAVGAIAAIVAVAALLLWLLFDPNDLRDELEDIVEEQTAREFSIDDDLALTLFPWLGIETGQMRLGHAAGFGDDDFASVDSAVARVRLMPLFRGRMEIGTIVLDGLELNLGRSADGRDNWSDLLGPASPSGGAGGRGGGPRGMPPGAAEQAFFSEMNIAGIDIRDGIVFWREDVDEVRYVISDISVATGPIVPGRPVDLDLGLQWVGVEPSFTARIDGRTSVAANPRGAGYGTDDLRLQFRVEDGGGEERIAGSLQTTATLDNASRTVLLADLELAADLTGFAGGGSDSVAVTAIAPSVSLDAASGTAEVPEAVTTVGGIAARWNATAATLADGPRFAGTVVVDTSPVDGALALFGIELDAELGNFELTSGFELEPLAGRVALAGLQATLLDMAVSGNLAAGYTEVSGDLQAPTFDPSAAFAVLPPEWLAGTNVTAIEQLALRAAFTADRAGGGFSLREFAATLPGADVSGNVERPDDGGEISGNLAAAGVDPQVLASIFPNLLPAAFSPARLGTLEIDTAFSYDAPGSMLRLDDLSAAAFGLRTSGNLSVRDPAGSPDVTGTLNVADFSPRALAELFGRGVPPTADPAALTRAELDADVSFGADRIELTAMRMRLDDTDVTGRVEVADFADPRYAFDLDMDRIDLDRYLPATSEAPDAPGGQDRGFDIATLADVNLAGRIDAGELRVSGISMNGFSTNIDLAEGLGQIEPLEAGLYGGRLRGRVELDVRAGGPLIELEGATDDVNVQGLLTALSGEPANTSGTGAFDVSLAGIGDNLDEMLSTATGSIQFTLVDGTVQGFNLDHTLCSAYNRLADYPRPAPTNDDATRYSLVRGTAQVREGIAQTADILGNVSSVTVQGGGRVDLVTQGIDIDLDAELMSAIRIPGCESLDGLVGESIPVTISGTVAEPRIGPDFEQLLLQRLQDELEEAVLDAVLDILN